MQVRNTQAEHKNETPAVDELNNIYHELKYNKDKYTKKFIRFKFSAVPLTYSDYYQLAEFLIYQSTKKNKFFKSVVVISIHYDSKNKNLECAEYAKRILTRLVALKYKKAEDMLSKVDLAIILFKQGKSFQAVVAIISGEWAGYVQNKIIMHVREINLIGMTNAQKAEILKRDKVIQQIEKLTIARTQLTYINTPELREVAISHAKQMSQKLDAICKKINTAVAKDPVKEKTDLSEAKKMPGLFSPSANLHTRKKLGTFVFSKPAL